MPLKKKKINAFTQKVSFQSPIQNPNDPANVVEGFLFLPRPGSECLKNGPIRATVLIHHVADKVDEEKMFASWAAQSGQGAVLLIYLPGYGPRKKAGSQHPFPDDLQEFKQRLFQSLLDIRIAGEYLKRETKSHQSQMQLGGISLGGITTALSSGFDPYFTNY